MTIKNSEVRKEWLLRLLALASVLLNVVLLFFLLPSENVAAEESRVAGRRASSPAEAKPSAVRASSGMPPGSPKRQPKRIGMPGEGRVAMPWVFAKQTFGGDAFVPYSDGRLNMWSTELLSITPSESAMLHTESGRLLALVKMSEAERVELIRDDSGAEFYKISADPEFSKRIRDTMAEAMIGILGPDRGAVLADAMVTENPLFPNPDVSFEISIETHRGPVFTIRRFAADGTSLGGKGKPMDLHHINSWLEQRYGHIVDFDAWKEYLKGGDTGGEPEAINPQ